MPKTVLAFLFLLYTLTRPAPAAPLYDSAGTSAAAQDGTGTVWALPANNGADSDGKISRWQTKGWAEQTVPEAAGFRLLTLTKSADGFVYGLWRKTTQGQPEPKHWLVTVTHGAGTRTLTRFEGLVTGDSPFSSPPALFAGTAGDVWVSGSSPLLRHIAADGTVQALPLKTEWYENGKIPDDYSPRAAFGSLVDETGKRWFWQNNSNGGMWPDRLRGPLLWDGKTLQCLTALTGIKAETVSLLAPRDASHLWAASGDDYTREGFKPGSLFVLDTRTLTAVPASVPSADAFRAVTQIFEIGGDWYFITRDLSRQTVSIWRKRGEVWKEVIPKLEEPGGYYGQSQRIPWLVEPSGTWFGAGGGLWWLPRDGKPAVWVDWRRGVMASNAGGLFPLQSGRILLFGQETGSAEMPKTPQPIRPLPPGVAADGLGAPRFSMPPLTDPHGHLWVQDSDGSGTALAEWNGRKWRTHPVPKTVDGAGGLYSCDTLGRIWLTTSVWHPPAQPQPVEGRAIYDPARDLWTSYATPQDALAAAALLPGMAFRPYANTYQPPVFSGDGRVTYTENGTTLVLYDGKKWRRWQTGEILANYGGNVPNLVHFNTAGHLEVGFGGPKCEWTPLNGWQRNGEQEAVKYQDPVPPGGPKDLWGNPAVDSLGVKWFVWNGDIYTAGYGFWAKQTLLSAPGSPFRLGFNIENVLRDPAGRLFFVSRPAGRYALVVWTPPAVPKPLLFSTPTAEDSVSVGVQSASPGLHRYLWRLNGGAWSAPSTASTQAFTGLPHGPYKFEAQTLDPCLQLSPVAAIAWKVTVAPEAQIARWVSALSAGPDTARESAVAGLVKQPAAALPALKAAHPAASDLGKWWIEAAIQEIAAGETPAIAN